MSKVFGQHSTEPAAAAPSGAPVNAPPASGGANAAAAVETPAAAKPTVDVEAMLSGMAAKYGHKVDWKYSIVDLMALLGIDSSMVNRRALASELGYTGDMNDSATMNTWLHKAVMRKLAENGGQVPATLLD